MTPVASSLLFCGVDEAGRGPLAGPVCAAAVILDPARPIPGLKDSKQLSEAKRDLLAAAIRERSLAWHVAWASVAEIEELNILHATMLAMRRAVQGLAVPPDAIEVDGNRVPPFVLDVPARAIVKGDATVAAISAAPEILTALRAALANRMQSVVNIALGASLSTVILTVPVMEAMALYTGQPFQMAMTPVQTVMVLITLVVSAINLNDGETNAIEGMTHFVLFATFIMLSLLGL